MSTEVSLLPDTKEKPSTLFFFTSPILELEKIKTYPVVWLPIFLSFGLSLTVVVLNVMQPETTKQLIEEIGMKPAEAKNLAILITFISGIISYPLILLFSSLILFLLTKIGTEKTTYRQMVSLTAFTMLFSEIGQLINTLFAVLVGTNSHLTSINGFINATGFLGGVLNHIEIFTIWSLILVGVGLHKISNVSKIIAIIISVLLFIILLINGGLSGAVDEGVNL